MNLWQIIKNQPGTLVWAIAIHLLAVLAISLSFTSSDTQLNVTPKEKVIEAVAIDESKINAEIQKLKKAEEKKKKQQKREIDKTKKARQERKQEEKRLQALKKKQKEQARLSRLKEEKEKKRIAELNRKREEQEKKQKEAEEKLAQIEKKRLQEEQRLAQEEKLRKEKEEQKKKAAAATQLKARQMSEVAKYKALIKREITRSWVIPPSYRKGMSCKVAVRLIPSGDVVGIRVIKSSGDSAFDRSVEMAVQKSSPLTVPKSDTGIFDYFREVEFVFDPNA